MPLLGGCLQSRADPCWNTLALLSSVITWLPGELVLASLLLRPPPAPQCLKSVCGCAHSLLLQQAGSGTGVVPAQTPTDLSIASTGAVAMAEGALKNKKVSKRLDLAGGAALAWSCQRSVRRRQGRGAVLLRQGPERIGMGGSAGAAPIQQPWLRQLQSAAPRRGGAAVHMGEAPRCPAR